MRKLRFSLVICTFERPSSLGRLLDSVKSQSLYPDEILIIDGSYNDDTKKLIWELRFDRLKYFKVGDADRGLTRQRNFGVKKTDKADVICFLDDDTIMEDDYFKNLISTYESFPNAMAVGGWITDITKWSYKGESYEPKFDEFFFDGYVRKLGQRNLLRKILGLLSNKPPGFMPNFSHGFSTGFLPPSNRVYEVEYFMGGVASYRRLLFNEIEFSTYFEGYGLYEDMDFCLRISKIGKLYVNTAARVLHFHEEAGRPDYFKYGQMVINNGRYVWEIKNPNPSLVAKIKWYLINSLLAIIRLFNYFNGEEEALKDFKGRLAGLLKIKR